MEGFWWARAQLEIDGERPTHLTASVRAHQGASSISDHNQLARRSESLVLHSQPEERFASRIQRSPTSRVCCRFHTKDSPREICAAIGCQTMMSKRFLGAEWQLLHCYPMGGAALKSTTKDLTLRGGKSLASWST